MEEWLEQFARTAFTRSADTAHDLKTPLNVAVLNLELLRMRIAKLAESTGDEKIAGYAAAIETELRRMARIFDAFFLLSAPPKGEGDPKLIDVAPIVNEFAPNVLSESAMVRAHDSRIRQAMKLFFEGASKVLDAESRATSAERSDHQLNIAIAGRAASPELEVAKIFKFYYTDSAGNPDLSLATARLIAETYGGVLTAAGERDTVKLVLTLPLGDR